MSSVGNIDTSELISSKENIQPLRRGRDTSILCAALQAVTDTDAQQELEKQRNEFEIRLRNDSSEDPLSDWCAYIHWIEQSFPKQAREGKLNVVLQKCINKFKDYEKYMNDVRFVKICIKYADIEENTVELLSQVHRHGIGVSCAELYIAWAEKYAVNNCFKKANAIYERGLQSSAQPLELLQEAHQNFQAFLVRKMLNEKEIFQPTSLDVNPAELRQPYNALNSLKSGSKEVVPSVRIGSNVLGAAGKLQQINSKDQKPKNNRMIKIFEDAENSYPVAEPKAKLEKVHSKKAITKENTIKPGVWTNKSKTPIPFTVEAPAPLPFEVHKDEDDEDANKKPKNVPSSVLKSHKVKASYEDENFANAPLFYPEPYDPTKLSMYCKEQVYAGGLEFQFEELHAIKYRKKKEEELKLKQMTGLKQALGETISIAAHKENIFVETQLASAVKLESHSKPKSEKKLRCDGLTEKKLVEKESRRKTLFCEPVKSNFTTEPEVLPTTDYSMNQTIHTKEALSEMQQLWFSKPASPVPVISKPAIQVGKSILKPSKPCFSLYVDESCLENFKTSENPDKPLDLSLRCNNSEDLKNNEKKKEGTARKLSYQVFEEEENPSRNKTGPEPKEKPFEDARKENVFAENLAQAKKVKDFEDDEDKENGVPEDYCGPVGKSDRKVSGILTPAENIEIAPLSDEEVEEDEEEAVGQDFSSIIQCNTTGITETWNFTKGFQFPKGESTPNVRKSLFKKEDCDESVFNAEAEENRKEKTEEDENKFEAINDKTIILHSGDKKTAEMVNFTKNLSVIAETSREYRSSSSGSSGASTLALRSSKNFPYTPSETTKSVKHSLTSSQTILHKTKVQSYTGYEASSEYSSFKTPASTEEKAILNTTFDLMTKLNAIESVSIHVHSRDEGKEAGDVPGEISKLKIAGENEEVEEKENIDPFNDKLIEKLLEEVDFPKAAHASGYFLLSDMDLAAPKVGSSITLGAHNYDVKKILGEGSYAKIFKLFNSNKGESMIAKFQKPAFPWEFYITREVQTRIPDKNLASHFMDVESAYFFKNSSVLLTRPVEFGDLLSVINKMKQGKMMCQTLAMYFTCQILKILETLHSCKIIHGDVKPDNFLLRNCNNKPQLQLIDFGRSIDMSLFPEGTSFTRIVTTEGFTTTEMRLGKPWTYQIDLYGIANCGHCLLFGDYMKVMEKDGVWNISKTIPRYWSRTEWKNFFLSLINVESCTALPDLAELRQSFEDVLEDSSELEFSLFKLQNLLNDR